MARRIHTGGQNSSHPAEFHRVTAARYFELHPLGRELHARNGWLARADVDSLAVVDQ